MNKTPISEVFNCDCMEYMKGLPDRRFDLVIADPPYGGGQDFNFRFGKGDLVYRNDRPNRLWFDEVFRISRHQIFWGGNYLTDFLPVSRCWISWYKAQPVDTFSDFELAWTSFEKVCRQVNLDSYGFRHADKRHGHGSTIHPTQKPIALYKWLLTNYAKPGQTIFDPMMGSQSSRIAAWDMGFDYYGCELDEDYFRDGCKRFEQHRANKTSLFEPGQMYQFEQQKLFEE